MKTIQEKLEDKKKATWLQDVQNSRDIVKEILHYGVSQDQLKHIIKFLALELEDIDTMKAISQILTEKVNEQPVTVNILKPGGKSNE